MIITQSQQANIREVLWHNLKYKETYNELFDHILTSIEQREDSEKLPNEIAHDIIHHEFGGWEKLKELEILREKTISRQLRGKLWHLMKSYFRFPLIIFTLFAAGSVYYAADQLPRKMIFLTLFLVVMTPVAMWCRIAPLNRWSKRYKASITESTAERIGTLGLSLFNCFMFIPQMFSNNGNHLVVNNIHASVLALVAVLYMVYSLSAIRIFQEDLKVSLVS